jgi:exonuclease III
LEILLNDRRIDVALITETHLTPNSTLNMKGYSSYRSDHPDGTAHGGVAILIKSTLKHNVHVIPPATQQIQVVAITVYLSNTQLNIAALLYSTTIRYTS